MAERCEFTELPTTQCAHCLGHAEEPAPKRTTPRPQAFKMPIDNVLDMLQNARPRPDTWQYGGWSWPLKHFDNMAPLLDAETTHADYGDDIFTRLWPADLATPLDFCAGRFLDDGGPMSGWFVAHHYRQVKRPRLPVARMARYVIECARLYINPATGEARTSAKYFGINHPDWESWQHLQLDRPLHKTENGTLEILALACSMGFHFGREYHWHVHLKRPGSAAGVLVPTTSQGARKVFRLRDYESGETRRKALQHWVDGHSRRIRPHTPDERLTWVRDHLRGRTKFQWEGMEGEIRVSEHDMRRLGLAVGPVPPRAAMLVP
ncbi:MAG: hypothetical protein ACRDVE_00005 [Actinocrinis sp.]